MVQRAVRNFLTIHSTPRARCLAGAVALVRIRGLEDGLRSIGTDGRGRKRRYIRALFRPLQGGTLSASVHLSPHRIFMGLILSSHQGRMLERKRPKQGGPKVRS